ncbi:hypothetical protein CkaCkLH20_12757 [Colletotrichum karsti]|uniref:N,N-dimethylformamidase beta subunit-like C-terminal domain-containing protein n=1 Tax=Colletotrichum karsti TaxID=1095194 RepID=A0A9P6LCU5_9PEZI|nr:uncharacterized protein CkaCkLH20_12757 [Colletotrichum karsti]KAF9869714.1 hypothetical protein CkaCkLH20_12757 [Colletotrichum karsti]
MEKYSVRPDLKVSEDEITGYVEPWVVSPGERASVKISSTKPNIKYQLVRLLQGLDMPDAPAPEKEVIKDGPTGTLNGRFQCAHPGSYGIVKAWERGPILANAEGLTVEFYTQPWLLDCKYPQALLSTLDTKKNAGLAVLLGVENDLILWIGTGTRVETVRVAFEPHRERWFHTTLTSGSPLLFAATYAANPTSSHDKPIHFFSGRLDSPRFTALGRVDWPVATYDFSIGIDTDEIFDKSGSGLDGILINAPTRAVRGHDWDTRLIGKSWKEASYGYGAIHFHEDDLDDARWDEDFNFEVPEHLRSGAYAIEVTDVESNLKDSIVFFVRPKQVRPQARLCFIFSTMTYLAYANEHMFDETKSTHISFPEGVQLVASENYHKMVRRTDLGLAIYDLHSDGHGVVYSTSKRPILNMRPDYIHWGFQRPREFSEDLLMVGFLEKLFGDGYDILTDHDLHLRGAAALATYDIVITGCHPEYPSYQTLDAYEKFTQMGGSIMYTGGNGFYWKSVTDPKRPHRMEVRRADVGARTHENPSGERVHSIDGTLGGLWRSLGRPPNVLFGVGSCASGKGPGQPFIPNQDALKDPSLAWVWKGFSDEAKKVFGTTGLHGCASGDELDRYDVGIGSPKDAVILATSSRHNEQFMLFNEELIFPMIGTLGHTSSLVRSDIIYYQTRNLGNVFSVGSINWNNSMAFNSYQNDVARITENVMREFLARAEAVRAVERV